MNIRKIFFISVIKRFEDGSGEILNFHGVSWERECYKIIRYYFVVYTWNGYSRKRILEISFY